MKYLPLIALLPLAACAGWSMDEPTEEQRAIAAYVCLGEESALSAYLDARGQSLSDVTMPDVGPERDLYCALRGNRIAVR